MRKEMVIVIRVQKVIESCETAEQLCVAERFMRLGLRRIDPWFNFGNLCMQERLAAVLRMKKREIEAEPC